MRASTLSIVWLLLRALDLKSSDLATAAHSDLYGRFRPCRRPLALLSHTLGEKTGKKDEKLGKNPGFPMEKPTNLWYTVHGEYVVASFTRLAVYLKLQSKCDLLRNFPAVMVYCTRRVRRRIFCAIGRVPEFTKQIKFAL